MKTKILIVLIVISLVIAACDSNNGPEGGKLKMKAVTNGSAASGRISATEITYQFAQVGVQEVELEEVESEGNDEADDDDDVGSGVVLDEVEEEVLVFIGGLGDDTADTETIARRIGTKVIRAQYYLDRLVTAGYLYDLLSRNRPTEYGITAEGRAYVVENELDE